MSPKTREVSITLSPFAMMSLAKFARASGDEAEFAAWVRAKTFALVEGSNGKMFRSNIVTLIPAMATG